MTVNTLRVEDFRRSPAVRSLQGMKVIETSLPGVLCVEPRRFHDPRGYFFETFRRDRYESLGLAADFVQDNVSYSTRGVLRGLHYQNPHPQGKLISVLQGEVFDVAVDVRVGSPTFLRWTGMTLSAENGRQLMIPEGFAHGFVVTGDSALVLYKCTEFYRPDCESSLAWNDPALGIDWPIDTPILSEKDRDAPLVEDSSERLPRFEAM
jgi:dTDP-4-dehydrorhamnose 3,5-epimerase